VSLFCNTHESIILHSKCKQTIKEQIIPMNCLSQMCDSTKETSKRVCIILSELKNNITNKDFLKTKYPDKLKSEQNTKNAKVAF